MKRSAVVLCGVLTVFSLALFAHSAQAAEKLGYIDLSKAFSEYGKTKNYDKALNDKEKAYTDERDKKISELKSLQDKLNLLNDKDRDAKRGELDSKMKSFQDSDRKKQEDLRKEQDEKMREILKDIETAVKKYAEKEGYTMVFNDRVLVYQNKTMEITDQVIAILNKNSK
ncbi:MAG: OmpH family outer membrane protein [Candidatus Omnitrophica bacterium]|nr:OmpH family outer membrane protein [Candidatus Omnitrophota bacterium]